MTRYRILGLLGALALAAVGGFVLAQQTQTVETEVRINARQLDDGRVEFALQQRDGDEWSERILPRGRVLPADVGHDRWLSSTPVTLSVDIEAADGAVTAPATESSGEADGPLAVDAIPWETEELPEWGSFQNVEANGWMYWRTSTELIVGCQVGSGISMVRPKAGSAWETALPSTEAFLLHWMEWAFPGFGNLYGFVCDISHPGVSGEGTAVKRLYLAAGTYICDFQVGSNLSRFDNPTNFIVRLAGRLMVNEITEWESYERLVTIDTPGRYHVEVDAVGDWVVYCYLD
ncbi:MAG: hypothetical protein OXG42_08035 [Chloroflexi bacterium]|nr:hypothetical protein [Chloroflexota bacterium]